MAGLIGPNSKLPGHIHRVPAGATCDDHEDRPAVARVQGETDSFGSELIDMCQECYDNYKKYAEEEAQKIQEEERFCEIGNHQAKGVTLRRDPSEGLFGPVYDMCPACHQRIISDFIGDDDLG